jgi:hypothetical protein
VLFAVAAGEAIIRLALPLPPANPTLRTPNTLLEDEPASWGVTGVTGRKRFTTNSLGLRGPELPQDQEPYRIIAVGGSTTECFVLDDSEEWPHVLMEKLTQGQQRELFGLIMQASPATTRSIISLCCGHCRSSSRRTC